MALEQKSDVEALGDRMTSSADEIFARLIKAIEQHEISPEEARNTFQQETLLRQQANSLYIDAAKCIVDGLTITQTSFMQIIDDANQRIAKIEKVAAFLDLVADLLSLATAAYAAKPKPILAAIKEVEKDLKALSSSKKTSS
ncbi:MAG: hypothetical protein PHR30_15010 [Gallionellaceae bacterium]|nr:hypothetical protein [Gallionellaceae bacterium]